jgi:hypothetical protein
MKELEGDEPSKSQQWGKERVGKATGSMGKNGIIYAPQNGI